MSRSALSASGDKFFRLGADGLTQASTPDRVRTYLILLAQIGGLLVILKLSRTIDEINNYYGVVLPMALAVAMARARYAASDAAAVRLLQLVGVITGAYALVHYPLFPVVLQGS
jgi:hypothetical protein